MLGYRDQDDAEHLLAQVEQALASNTPLRIQGADSKAFLGRQTQGQLLDVRSHRGIVNYDPTELVITARAGTPLQQVLDALDDAGQMLPCEPPFAERGATLGGVVAAGLSGPRRPWAGAIRDFVLGTRLITGHGQHLRFGGEVMKNVAGYDLSRLLAGSLGCLGVLTEISLKVLPKPRCCTSLALPMSREQAAERLAEWRQQPLPISAACFDGEILRLRLEGGEGSVKAAHERLGGELIDSHYWHDLNAQRLPFFAMRAPLWRLSLPERCPPLDLPGQQLLDWGGGQRWLKSTAFEPHIRQLVSAHGGHATCLTPGAAQSPLQPLPPTLLRYHRQLKAQLDPKGIFNPGRMYQEL
jgi:glycolate oxidase FAD binding subunit